MLNKKILVADDDSNILELISLYLKKEGFDVVIAHDGKEAIKRHSLEKPELIILDIMLPEMNGFDVCKEIRKTSTTPIIMLTAKNEDYDKILGLEIGADDYITKPFNPRELIARVKVVLRRFNESQNSNKKLIVEYEDLYINRADYIVKNSKGIIHLTPKETEILWLLASNPGRVFSRDHILETIWGYDYIGDNRTVDTHIKRIRQKVEQENTVKPWEIKSIWGIGYRFEVEENENKNNS